MFDRTPQYKRRGYLLPDVTEPNSYRCVCVPVPNDAGHIRAFLGQLDALGYWYTWQRDAGKHGTIAARVWRAISDIVRNNVDCSQEVTGVSGCCCGKDITNTRFLSDGTMQVSYDGGVTWENAPPGIDPRYSGAIAAPIPGDNGFTKRCNAAGSARAVMEDQQQQVSNDAGAWSGISGMVGALISLLIFIGIIGTGGALTPLLLALAAALLGAGKAAFDAAFNATVWETVQCVIYCHTTESADPYSADDIAQIRQEIAAQLTGVAAAFIDKTLEAWGQTGLTNASRAGFASDFDCTTCACPTCDYSHWTANEGVMIERAEDHITVQAIQREDGNWYAGVRSANWYSCCCHVDYDLLSGAPLTVIGYCPCGLDYGNGNNYGYAYTGQSANQMVFASTYGQFTLKVFSSQPCD